MPLANFLPCHRQREHKYKEWTSGQLSRKIAAVAFGWQKEGKKPPHCSALFMREDINGLFSRNTETDWDFTANRNYLA